MLGYPNNNTEDPNIGIATTAPKHSPQTNAMNNHSGYRVGLPNHNQQKEKEKQASRSPQLQLESIEIQHSTRNLELQLEIIKFTQCV